MKNRGAALFLLLGLLLAAPHAIRAEKDEINARYKEAMARNDVEQAMSILCDAAKVDPKKYEKRCTNAQVDANKQLQKFEILFNTGKAELDRKDYSGAIRDLEKITFGVRKAEAQNLIHEANDAQGHPLVLAQNRTTLGVAQAAYLRGDFTAAKQTASQVKVPELQPQAQQMLNNIRTYEQAIQEADSAMKSGNLAAAQQKYNFALAINANGPGDPSGKLQQIATQSAASKSSVAKIDTSTPTATGGGDAKKTNPLSTLDAAAKLKIDLFEAHAAEASGNNDAALAAYERALALNARLPEALAGRQRILEAVQKDVQALESKLVNGIRSYYGSHFAASGDAISLYLKAGGTHNKGAAHFYLGATFASEAILADTNGKTRSDTSPGKLRERALQEFQLARREHYQPIQKYIAPKVLALWKESPS
jgi:tetratricopeptide (TPR) repeat protein